MTGPDGHASAARKLVDFEPFARDEGPSIGGRLQRLCRAATRDLTASGVGVSVMSRAGGVVATAASSPRSSRVEELQFELGEGPCLTACRTGSPVLVPDLEQTVAVTWPGYASAALSHGVQAVFAFPMQDGATRLGALDVYRERPGELSDWAVARALGFAEVAMDTILEGGGVAAVDGSDVWDQQDVGFEVYQAQGMVMVQLAVPPEEALARMRGYAFAENRSLREVAHDIVARRLVLESDT
ncbi:GAF and ANTAR domain-containing protein [Nocardioides panacis]|uniref:GAF and ANTAR domain-containing protein n=1 Tax=Nocardioides panacis TaxID=2849501 RepID=A0A975T0Q3_9ACTN|nr:GAF and ANTAR domain-containing protein [Nocardioides panacis]QWZ08754.1 GAF and ANTAR domain-containing protein [Nocardioides panacis]